MFGLPRRRGVVGLLAALHPRAVDTRVFADTRYLGLSYASAYPILACKRRSNFLISQPHDTRAAPSVLQVQLGVCSRRERRFVRFYMELEEITAPWH